MTAGYFLFRQNFVHAHDGVSVARGYDYILRQGAFSHRDGEEGRLVASGSENMPAWARENPRDFWEGADAWTASDGDKSYRDLIALPRGLDDAQLVALSREIVESLAADDQYPELRMPCTWALHSHKASDGAENTHIHIHWSRCCDDGIDRSPELYFSRAARKFKERGGAPKARAIRTKKWLLNARRKTAEIINSHLQRAGLDVQVSAETYERQNRPADQIRRRRKRETRADWEARTRAEQEAREAEAQLQAAREALRQAQLEENQLFFDCCDERLELQRECNLKQQQQKEDAEKQQQQEEQRRLEEQQQEDSRRRVAEAFRAARVREQIEDNDPRPTPH